MGLIKALTNSVSSEFGDQFKEYVDCPEVANNVLIQRGRVNHGKGNKNPSEGIITNGSTIIVPEGMSMLIVDNGAITEFTAETGTYTYDKSTEPTIFEGGVFNGIKDSIKNIGKRITYGGQTAHDQRVYYINTKIITGNKFGSPQPKKITDEKYGMIEVTFFGEYAFRVVNPAILVSNIIGTNPKDTVTYEEIIGSQLKTKFIEQVTKAISIVMRKAKVSFGDIGLYGSDISDEMNACLDESWRQQYGLEITDVAIGDINLTDESMKRVNRIDDATIFSDRNLQSGLMAQSTAQAMENASSNANGAMMGFAGMNMATNAGVNLMGTVNQNSTLETSKPETTIPEPGTIFGNSKNTSKETDSNTETTNGNTETTASNVEVTNNNTPTTPKFCTNCGTKVTGNFCSNCGAKIN